MGALLGVFVAALGVASGCKDNGSAECGAWIDKSLECEKNAPTGEDREFAIKMLDGMCRQALQQKASPNAVAEQMNETIRAKVKCVTAPTCEEFKTCEAKANK